MRLMRVANYSFYIVAIIGMVFTVQAWGALAGSEARDVATLIVLAGSLTGAFAIPLMGYATQDYPFNPRQYVLAVIVVLPTTLGWTLTTLENMSVESISVQTGIILFISVLLNAMGIEYGKSRTAKALKEGKKVQVTEEGVTVVDELVI